MPPCQISDQDLTLLSNIAEAQQRPLLWRELAKAVPGRSNKDCRRRWWNSLADGNAKGPWAEEEDERLIAAVQTYGTNWTRVAQEVKSRGSDQCSSHWSHVLDPNINYCDWTEEEVRFFTLQDIMMNRMTKADHRTTNEQDADLLHEVLAYGTRWAHIASCHNPCRTTLALKNRYSTLRLKSENRNRSRQQSCEGDFHHHHHNSSSGSAILFASSQPSDQRLPLLEDRTPNPSDTTSDGGPSSQARDEDDEDEDSSNNNEDEEEDSVVEAEEGDVIHAWLDEARHISNGGGGGDAESSLRLGAMHIQVPDVAALSSSWDVWTKFGGLPTPHGHQHQHHHHHHAQGGGGSNSSGLQQMSGTEAVGPGAIDVESYLQLGSPMALLNGASSAQEPSPLSERCFYTNGGGGGGEDAHCARTTADQTTSSSSYPLHGMCVRVCVFAIENGPALFSQVKKS